MTVINWTNVTSAAQLLDLSNSTTSGGFWTVTLFLVFLTLLIIFLQFGWETAILGSSFIALIMALFLTYMEVVAFKWVLFFIGLLLFFFLYIAYKSN